MLRGQGISWYVVVTGALFLGPPSALLLLALATAAIYRGGDWPPGVIAILNAGGWVFIVSVALGGAWGAWAAPFFASGDERRIRGGAPRAMVKRLRLLTFVPSAVFVATGLLLVSLGVWVVGLDEQGRVILVRIGLIALAVAAALAAFAWGWSVLLRKRIQARATACQVCYACGYDRRGNPGGACPECGFPQPLGE